MNRKSLVLATATLMLGSSPLLAQEAYTSELDASIRLGVQMNSEPETTAAFRNFGSRLRWNGTANVPDSNTTILSYLEFGFDQDAGVSQTRQGWVGAQGDFGIIKGGKQYRAFYDAVSSITDIAWWGSCLNAIGCGRQSSVIKYSNSQLTPMGDVMASATMLPNDIGDDVLDQLDLGGRFALNDNLSVGAAISIGSEPINGQAIETGINGETISRPVDTDSGMALGLGATTTINDMDVGAIVQFATDEYALNDDNVFLVEGAVRRGPAYVVGGLADSGDRTPFFITVGYQMPLVEDRALMYFEAGLDDPDREGTDTNIIGRAVMVFSFDAISTGS